MPNKTISLPDDVLPIIDRLDVPFSRWVTAQLRRHAAQSPTTPFREQLLADAALADAALADAALVAADRPTAQDAAAIGARMERSAPW
jgi:hypothetical protein